MYDSYWVVPEEDSDIVHYGVKGMKWGVRKSEYESMSRKDRRKLRKRKNEGYSDHQREIDKIRLGGGAVRRINKRMNKGTTYKQAKRREYARRFATSFAVSNAALWVRRNPEKSKRVSRRHSFWLHASSLPRLLLNGVTLPRPLPRTESEVLDSMALMCLISPLSALANVGVDFMKDDLT